MSAQLCPGCGAILIGDYCHVCGQARITRRLTAPAFLGEIARRVLRLDLAVLVTLGRALVSPGRLAGDYLHGRRRGILDPIFYFVSTIFIQFALVALTRSLEHLLGQTSSADLFGTFGRYLVLKLFVVIWIASIWRVFARSSNYNFAEYAVFAIYSFGTLSLLWATVPLLEISAGLRLSDHRVLVASVMLGIGFVYLVHGLRNFVALSIGHAALRAGVALVFAYALLLGILGVGGSIEAIAPLLSGQ